MRSYKDESWLHGGTEFERYCWEMRYIGVPIDVLEVQLVGEEWWTNALPILAILISLASVGLTLWLKFRDDARVRLSASPGYVVGFGQDQTLLLHLEATNVGRTGSTVIRSIGLRLSDGRGIASVKPSRMDRADSRGRCNTRGQLAISKSRSCSAGVSQPRVLRGRALSCWATRSNSSGSWTDRSVPLGKY